MPRKLALTPLADGFSVSTRPSAVTALLDSPVPVYQPVESVQAHDVEVRWFLTGTEADYFWAFWRTASMRGVRRFRMDLPVEGGTMIECLCAFRRPPKLSAVEGLSLVVVASVEVVPINRTVYSGASDAALVAELQAL